METSSADPLTKEFFSWGSGGFKASTTPVRLLTDDPSLSKEGSLVVPVIYLRVLSSKSAMDPIFRTQCLLDFALMLPP